MSTPHQMSLDSPLASPVPGIPTLSFWFLAIQRLEEEVMLP